MIQPETYERRTFPVEAVRVTDDNMHEVAKWCMGEVETQKRPSKKGEGGYVQEVPYLKVNVLRPLNDRQTMAFVGDWVLKTGTSFKIYTDIAFHKNFVKKVDYDTAFLPESDAEFMVLRNGIWEPLSPAELKQTLAPLIRETMAEVMESSSPEEPSTVEEPNDVPQVRLARRPATSEIPSD